MQQKRHKIRVYILTNYTKYVGLQTNITYWQQKCKYELYDCYVINVNSICLQEGKQQEYNLGKYTQERYNGFIPSDFSWLHFMGHSTDTQRTKTSCQSVMAGIFSSESEVWSENLPLNRYYFKLPDEEIFSSSPDCKIFDTELSNVLIHGEMFQDLEEEYASEIEIIRTNADIHIKSIFGVYSIYECLYIEESMGLALPNWTASVYPEPMQTLAGYALKALSYTEEAKRLSKCNEVVKIKTHSYLLHIRTYCYNHTSMYLISIR